MPKYKRTIYVYECSNPKCRTLWIEDLHGPCLECKQENGAGWSCITREVLSPLVPDPTPV